jgi:predicted AlkP superfamily phosphohydrolase/phosphomutase/Flp pilus assembly protein TadD
LSRLIVFVIAAVAAVLLISSIKLVGEDEVVLRGSGESLRQLRSGINFVTPFASVRRYKLTQRHVLGGDRALRVTLSGRRSASLEAALEIHLDRDRIEAIDRDYGDRLVEKLLRPLLVRELSASFSMGQDLRGALGQEAELRIGASVNEKTQSLGIELASVSFGTLEESGPVVHDLERGEGVKVFILGLDAYDWIIMDKVAETRSLPNIDRIKREGAWGNLRSIEPLVSPLVWTTIVTGVTPDVHGITDFLVRDEDTGEDIPVTSSMRRVPAIWNMVSLYDLSCGFVGWFASYPAEEVKGFVVSDRFAYHMFDPRWQLGEKRISRRGLTYPEDLFAEIEPLNIEPETVYDEIGRYVRGRIGDLKTEYDPKDPDSNLRLIISAYETYENIMRKLYPERRPDLFGIYFEFTDSICHLLMKYMKPAMAGVSPEDESRYGDGVAAIYVEADRIIGDVLEMIDDDTVLMVVSDHGFKSGDMRPLSDSRMGFGQAINWHRINGAVAFYGPRVKPGYEVIDVSVLDIAPTILYLLGLPVDENMLGRVMLEAFDDAWVESHPVTYTGAYDSLIVGARYEGEASGADKALKDKLVSLGYVAGGNRSLVNLANYYHRNGKYEEALELWKQIIEDDPNDLGARIGMSNAYFELGKDDLAIQGLLDVLKIDPKNTKTLQSLATIHIERGRATEALRYAEQGLEADPADGQSYFNKGLALELLGRVEEAAHQYRQAVRYAPDLAEAYANLAQIYVAGGRATQALEAARKAVELASDKPEMHYVLGMALNAGGSGQQALERFLAAVRMDEAFVPAYIGACGILMARGNTDSVVVLSTEALRTPSQYANYVHNIKGTAHLSRGEIRLAEREFKAALEADRTFTPARMNLAKVYVRQGQRDDAARELRAVLAADPNNSEAQALLENLGR